MQLCFATNNKNKVHEIATALGEQFKILSLKDIGCSEELPENQATIEGNSMEKTQYVWDNYRVDCFGDDTGLEVEALGGEPGVYSARYAGPECDASENMNLLLKNLEGKENRQARFKTIITLFLKGKAYQFEGIVQGTIRKELSGAQGFGYDPVFQPEGYDITFAEMSTEQKNEISHRGLAVKKLIMFLKDLDK